MDIVLYGLLFSGAFGYQMPQHPAALIIATYDTRAECEDRLASVRNEIDAIGLPGLALCQPKIKRSPRPIFSPPMCLVTGGGKS